MIVIALQALLVGIAIVLAVILFRANASHGARGLPSPASLPLGGVVAFFDTLGIGSFAPTTAAIKFFKLTDDDLIPGTLNVGLALATIAEALIFIGVIGVDPLLLASCIIASVAGAVIGAGIVSRLPVNSIRIGMGIALIVAAGIFTASNLHLTPGGGEALTLAPPAFALAVILHFIFGALMTLGIGLYAPALMTLSILGMNPRAAFPIMMGACAFLMPASSIRFIAARKYDPRLAAGFTLAGIPAVLVAAFIVKEMPLDALRWLVTVVVLIAAGMMLDAARKGAAQKG